MPEISTDLREKVLKILSSKNNAVWSFDELTKAVAAEINYKTDELFESERKTEFEVMNALINLADHNLIILDPLTDEVRLKQ